MSFHDLPPEVLDLIGKYLRQADGAGGSLSRYATITPAFRETIEAITFAELKLDQFELNHASELLRARPSRRAALCSVALTAVLPAFTSVAALRFERAPDIRRNNRQFTDAIVALFQLLAQCDEATNGRPIVLELVKAYSPMDPQYRTDKDAFYPGTTSRSVYWKGRHRHSYLRCLDVAALPPIRRVHGFWFRHELDRRIEPATFASLAAKFPNLRRINWSMGANEWRKPQRRGDLRRDFGNAMATVRAPECRSFALSWWCPAPINHHFEPPDVRGADDPQGPDGFSLGLGRFLGASTYLVGVRLDDQPICIAAELFWHEGQALSLPHVRDFALNVCPTRPQGGYYLVRDPHCQPKDDSDNESEQWAYGSDSSETGPSSSESEVEDDEEFFAREGLWSEEEDGNGVNRQRRRAGLRPRRCFRTWPAPALIELHQAVARAVAHMPQIQTLQVTMQLDPGPRTADGPAEFGFSYYPRGVKCYDDTSLEEREKNRIGWDAPNLWKMEGDLQILWQEVMGHDGIVRYSHW